MKRIPVFFLLTIACVSMASPVCGMNMPGATEDGIMHDCKIVAEMSVMLLQMKAKTPPEQLLHSAKKMLENKEYKGSFGDASFIARMYTGSALQLGSEVDKVMASASADDIDSMMGEHFMDCMEKAMTELQETKAVIPTSPPR